MWGRRVLVAPRPWVGAWGYTEEEGALRAWPNLYPTPFGQIILALGNYMNSSKRGAVYGFKLQSLDLVR